MHIEAATLDDLLHDVLTRLIENKETVVASRGSFTEIFGAVLHLSNPRARLSRSEMKGKVFSALGEWLWYLSGANDLSFIDHYLPGIYSQESEDNVSVRSGYGERLFNHRGVDQIASIIKLLRLKPTTRRAVIQLFDSSDLERSYASIPCTCTLQFLVRNGQLNMFVNMRSNDAYYGLPHDVFAFTMLQELVARSVDVDLGEYKHSVGSLHLYETNIGDARRYLNEDWQASIAMQQMPEGDPWDAVTKLRAVEEALRVTGKADISGAGLDEYWKDLCRLLAVYRSYRDKDIARIQYLRSQMNRNTFNIFIDAKIDALLPTAS